MTNKVIVDFDLNAPMSVDARKSLREQIFYLDPAITGVSIDGSSVIVELHAAPTDEASLRDAVSEMTIRTAKSFRRVRDKTLFEHTGSGRFNSDPLPLLLERKDVRRHAPGIFTFQGEFLRLIRALDNFFRAYALELGATEQAYPPTVLTRLMIHNGYLRSFPHHALLVSGVKREIKGVEGLAAASGDVVREFAQNLGSPDQVLAPTVCYRCFEAMANESMGVDRLIFTGTAHCNRNEGFIEDSLTRLQSFLMREIVFLCSDAEVDSLRYEIIEQARGAISSWGVTARLVTASDPFFAVEEQSKRGYQTLMQLKYEMQLMIPHSGEWLSCMSFNNHQRTLLNAYDISRETEDLASGCVGYGFERLAYAVYSQFGLVVAQWPSSLQHLLRDYA